MWTLLCSGLVWNVDPGLVLTGMEYGLCAWLSKTLPLVPKMHYVTACQSYGFSDFWCLHVATRFETGRNLLVAVCPHNEGTQGKICTQ